MSKYSYLATPEELMKSFTPNHLLNMEGYMAAWESNPEVLKKLLPPPLEVVDNVVCLYSVNILNPTLMPWYREADLMIKCKYQDRPGYFIQSLLLNGPGTEMGTYLGRERLNMPKKMVEGFTVTRNATYGKSVITRGGVDLLTLEADINGKYNDPKGEALYADHKPGNHVPYNSFFFLYGSGMVDGKPGFMGGRMVELNIDVEIKRWEPATMNIKLGETPNDPWAELEVVKMLGGAYTLFDMYLNQAVPHGEVDANEIVKRTFKQRFDSGVWGEYHQVR